LDNFIDFGTQDVCFVPDRKEMRETTLAEKEIRKDG